MQIQKGREGMKEETGLKARGTTEGYRERQRDRLKDRGLEGNTDGHTETKREVKKDRGTEGKTDG